AVGARREVDHAFVDHHLDVLVGRNLRREAHLAVGRAPDEGALGVDQHRLLPAVRMGEPEPKANLRIARLPHLNPPETRSISIVLGIAMSIIVTPAIIMVGRIILDFMSDAAFSAMFARRTRAAAAWISRAFATGVPRSSAWSSALTNSRTLSTGTRSASS